MNRQQLERGADAIEVALYQHNAPVKVTGGHVTPRWVQFMVQPGLGVKVTQIESLAREIAVALGVPSAQVSQSGGAVRIDVPRNDPQPLQLARMLDRIPLARVPGCTALLGLADDGAPLLVRFPSPAVGHVLISGNAGSGKTSLIITALLSLACYNHPRHVQIVAIGSGLACLRDLPHMLQADDLQRLMVKDHAIARPAKDPRIVIAVDEPRADMLPTLATFAVRGAAAGVHVIAAAREPLDLPVKVRITAERQPGDFRADWTGNSPIRFLAAHIAAHEIGSFIQSLK